LVPEHESGESVAADWKAEFSAAVRECLANCYGKDFPLAALAEYVARLKQTDWTPSEIHKLEAAVTRILLAVVTPKERDTFIRRIIETSLPALSPSQRAGIPDCRRPQNSTVVLNNEEPKKL
jgi:hypothetical protein